MKFVLCKWAGCSALCEKYYCPKHQAMAEQKRKERLERHKAFANAKRFDDGFYQSAAWRNLRKKIFSERGFCVRCGTKQNLSIHHLVPIRNNPSLALDENNLVVLCKACHGIETQREVEARKR